MRLLIAGLALIAAPSLCWADSLLPSGTPVSLKLLQDLSSSSSSLNQTVRFEVSDDVKTDDGTVVIKKGSKARAVVTYVEPRGDRGRAGVVSMMFRDVQGATGSIPLSGSSISKGKDKNLFWWSFWLGGMAALSQHGYDVTVPSGTEYTAYTDKDITAGQTSPVTRVYSQTVEPSERP